MVVNGGRLPSDAWRQADDFNPIPHERIVGINNLLSIAWLSRGLELAAAVARLLTNDSKGSSFLIAPDLLLTNNHVLPDQEVAGGSTAEFNYQTNWAGQFEPAKRYPLDPSHFVTNEELDYTIVRVRDSPGDLFGYVDLANRTEPSINDYVSVIQHPMGAAKQVCLTDNKVAAVFADRVQYSTDTEPGSSGSPVFNQQWQIVGLHHAGGGLAGPDGKQHFTNEGILISSIIRDAAGFLGASDTLYDLSFGELRAALVNIVENGGLAEPAAAASAVIRRYARFAFIVEDWAKLNGKPQEGKVPPLAAAGIAVGAALRHWARREGHEAIREAANSVPPPSQRLYRIMQPLNSTEKLPADVYASVLAALRDDRGLVAPIVEKVGSKDDVPAACQAFLIGVCVGAKAFEGPRDEGRTT